MSRQWFLRSLTLVIGLSLLLGGCASPTPTPSGFTPTPAPITLSDGLSRLIKLPAPAQRVVSLAPSNTEILFAIGAGAQVVGRDEFSDYPAAAQSLPSVGGSMGQYSVEAIVALRPDLVLASELNSADFVKSLEGLGLTVFWLGNPKDLAGLYSNLSIVGRLTGHENEAGGLINNLQARVKAVQEKVAPLSYAPVVFYELDATDPAAPYTAGQGSFVELLINLAGGINAGSALPSAWAPMSAEQLVAANPAIIILGDSAYGVTPEAVAARPGWAGLAAVQSSQVYSFDDNLVSRPGPRLVNGLEALAKLIHPEVFK
jgi:iron complex transport system substrate-binding protein